MLCPEDQSLKSQTEIYIASTMRLLSAAIGRPDPMPNNTFCPTLECRVNDFTSLAMCPICDSEVLDFGKNNKYCYYSITKGFNTINWVAGYNVSRLITSLEKTLSNISAATESVHGNFSTFSEFRAVASKSEEGSIWKKTCSLEFDNAPRLDVYVKMEPSRWLSYSKANDLRNSTMNPAQILSGLPWVRSTRIRYSSTGNEQALGRIDGRWSIGGDPEAGSFGLEGIPESLQQKVSGCFPDLWKTMAQDGANELKSTCITLSGDSQTLDQLDSFGDMNATLTRCRLSICARRYQNVTISPAGMRGARVTDLPWILAAPNVSSLAISQIYSARDDTNNTYRFDQKHISKFGSLLYDTAETRNFQYLLNKNNPSSSADWMHFFQLVADVFTQTILSPYNPDAKHMIAEAYGPVIFVRVRWVWSIFPLALVLAASVLLCLTMYRSRSKAYLYKNSILATLFHGLGGWDTYELLPDKTSGRETYADMMDIAKGMMASLKKDGEGYLKLKRE
ncbi:hypothetical protein CC86DRAFT_428306 [Ophiobolus disseminans]|uniref:Uncharacterized protein n=1 Tax=Ophiobolus disseminans TaxID=1469910 RepID=A0A6A6ZHM1_9PLEO|nr:hypothetical protein CC86DRAFT_428306 [Ophiobolus disseminans]